MYKGEPLDLLKRYNTCGDRLRNLGLPTLQYRRIRADLVETYKIINNVDKVDATNIFLIRKTNTRGHKHKIFKKNTVEQIGGNTVFHKESWTIGTHYQIK